MPRPNKQGSRCSLNDPPGAKHCALLPREGYKASPGTFSQGQDQGPCPAWSTQSRTLRGCHLGGKERPNAASPLPRACLARALGGSWGPVPTSPGLLGWPMGLSASLRGGG